MKLPVTVIIGLALLGSPLAADEPPIISKNPFARPPSEITGPAAGPVIVNDAGEIEIQLNATMVGASVRYANVAGKIIRPGEEVDGFVLLYVHEDHAIFERGNYRTTVYVKPELVENDE